MQLKQLIKSGLGFIIAKKHPINKIGKNVYIGKQTKKIFNTEGLCARLSCIERLCRILLQG